MGGLRVVAVGAVLIAVDVRINQGIDLVPDVLGALLIVGALALGVRKCSREFLAAIPVAAGLLVATIIATPRDGSLIDGGAESLVGLGFAATLALVYFGVARVAEPQSTKLSRDGTIAGWICVAGAVLSATAGILALRSNAPREPSEVSDAAIPILILLIVCLLALFAWMLLLLVRASKLETETPPANAAVDRSAPEGRRSRRHVFGLPIAVVVVAAGGAWLLGGAASLGTTPSEKIKQVQARIAAELEADLPDDVGPADRDGPGIHYTWVSTSEGPTAGNWLIGEMPDGINAIEVRGRRTKLSSHKLVLNVGNDGPARAKLIGPGTRRWRDRVGNGRILSADDEGVWVRLPGDWTVHNPDNSGSVATSCDDIDVDGGTGCSVFSSAPEGGVWRLLSAQEGPPPSTLSAIALRGAQGVGENHPRQATAYETTLARAIEVLGFEFETAGSLGVGPSPPTKPGLSNRVDVIAVEGRFGFLGVDGRSIVGDRLVIVRDRDTGWLLYFEVRTKALPDLRSFGKGSAIPLR